MTAFKPENFSIDLQRARNLLKKGDYADALAQVDVMLDAFPGDVRLEFLKGVVQRRLGEHVAACQSAILKRFGLADACATYLLPGFAAPSRIPQRVL